MKSTKLQNPSLRKRKGFTLIELIVVIAILAILAAIAIPTFLGSLNRARWNTDVASARVIVSAAQIYFAENGASQPSVNQLYSSNYLDEVPDPQFGTAAAFTIYYSADGVVSNVQAGSNTFYPATAYTP